MQSAVEHDGTMCPVLNKMIKTGFAELGLPSYSLAVHTQRKIHTHVCVSILITFTLLLFDESFG